MDLVPEDKLLTQKFFFKWKIVLIKEPVERAKINWAVKHSLSEILGGSEAQSEVSFNICNGSGPKART